PEHGKLGHREAGDVAARARQACDEAGADRIGGLSEHDREAAAFLQQRLQGQRAADQDHVRIDADEPFRRGANATGSAAAPAVADAYVAALGPAQLLQRLPECRDVGVHFRIALGERIEHADAPHPLGLLRACRDRPSGYTAADQCDEVPPPHGAYPQGQGSRTSTTLADLLTPLLVANPFSAVRASLRW